MNYSWWSANVYLTKFYFLAIWFFKKDSCSLQLSLQDNNVLFSELGIKWTFSYMLGKSSTIDPYLQPWSANIFKLCRLLQLQSCSPFCYLMFHIFKEKEQMKHFRHLGKWFLKQVEALNDSFISTQRARILLAMLALLALSLGKAISYRHKKQFNEFLPNICIYGGRQTDGWVAGWTDE